MTEYTLEILDGDRAGQIVELQSEQFSIGRRPSNDLVLDDDKCSGRHAEIVVEDGQPVLRDVGSTNGTFLDGQRIEEIALGHGDEFRVGKTRMRFHRASAASPAGGGAAAAPVAGASHDGVEDVSISAVDTSRLTGKKKRSILLPAVLLLVVAAVAVVVVVDPFADGGGPGGGGRSRRVQPLKVSGNLLGQGVATFEDDESEHWNLAVVTAAVDFDFGFGASANTGRTGLVARLPEVEDGEAPIESGFAIARTNSPVRVEREAKLRVGAHLSTDADARAIVRVRFEGAEDDEDFEPRTTGTGPMRAEDGFEEVAFEVGVPKGARSAHVELLAYLPRLESEAAFDDVFVTTGGSVETLEMPSGKGSVLEGAGTDFGLRMLEDPLVFEVLPIVGDDPFLQSLADTSLLVASDAGLTFEPSVLDEEQNGFQLAVHGGAFELRLPGSDSLRTRAEGVEEFEAPAPDFEAVNVVEVLVGSGRTRLMLVPDGACTVRGRRLPDSYGLSFEAPASIELRSSFGESPNRARELLRQTASVETAGEKLDLLDRVARRYPHDDAALREAGQRNAELLATIEQRAVSLREKANEATLFDAPVGYRRVLDGLTELETELGAERFGTRESLTALRGALEGALARREGLGDTAHAARLRILAEAFAELPNGTGISSWVSDYANELAGGSGSEDSNGGDGR
ncbi:MAG: FHA domain-containing protein [Planctomycetota bacterium]